MESLKEIAMGIIRESTVPSVFKKLFEEFPRDATSWADATDEMRDITKLVRETYNEIEHDFTEDDEDNPKYIKSMNFRSFGTPSEWNTKSQNEIVRIWNLMSPKTKKICLRYLKMYYNRWF